jgi:Ca2+-binding EF-hand superfamily protein
MNSYYGLQNAYQYALPQDGTGVTQKDLLTNKTAYAQMQSNPFSSYLVTNFTQVDKNRDGKITSDEMTGMMETFSKQGLSYQQLMTLSGSAGIKSDDLNNILNNFKKIDKNGDGKVSMAEINAYQANKQVNDKIAELKNKKSSDFSIMYADYDKSKDSEDSKNSKY